MKYPPVPVLLLALCLNGPVFAVGGGGEGTTPAIASDPYLRSAQAAIAGKDWPGAQATLQKALASNTQNADYHNLYAYALRKGPSPDMDKVFFHYGEALRINPKHLGAHEYLGEAYLAVDNPVKAREQLAALDKLCRFSCEQYRDLKKAVSAYDASHPH